MNLAIRAWVTLCGLFRKMPLALKTMEEAVNLIEQRSFGIRNALRWETPTLIKPSLFRSLGDKAKVGEFLSFSQAGSLLAT